MTRRRARWVWGAAVLVLWVSWPTVVLADTCKERANAIAARRVGANVVDPDCKRAGVIGATLAVTVAAAAVGVAAVGLGLGLAGLGSGVSTLASAAGTPPPTGQGWAALDKEMPTAEDATTVGSTTAGAGTTEGSATVGADAAIASIVKGSAALSVLERAGLVEPVRNQPGVYRPRAALEAGDWQDDRSTGLSGVAYRVRADGTLDPDLAVGMIEAAPGSPVAQSATLATPSADAFNALIRSLPAGELRQALIELVNPAKLVGMKFDDIERFREDYWDAKQLQDPSQSQQTQDYVIYTFGRAFGFSPGAARALLELPNASWNVLATFIASLA